MARGIELFKTIQSKMPRHVSPEMREDGTVFGVYNFERGLLEYEIWPDCDTIIVYTIIDGTQFSRAFKPDKWERAANYILKAYIELARIA